MRGTITLSLDGPFTGDREEIVSSSHPDDVSIGELRVEILGAQSLTAGTTFDAPDPAVRVFYSDGTLGNNIVFSQRVTTNNNILGNDSEGSGNENNHMFASVNRQDFLSGSLHLVDMGATNVVNNSRNPDWSS